MPNPPKQGLLAGKTGGIKHKWWLLGGIGVGGLGFLYYRKATATPPPTSDTVPADAAPADTTGYNDPYAGYDSSYGTGAGGSYGSYGGTIPQQPDPTFAEAAAVEANAAVDAATALGNIADAATANAGKAPPETNKQWMHEAIDALMRHGYTHAEAVAAVAGYVAGAPLTKKQAHTVESALGHVGQPPNPVPRLHLIPTPKPTTKDSRSSSKKPKAPAKKPAEKTHH